MIQFDNEMKNQTVFSYKHLSFMFTAYLVSVSSDGFG